VRICLGGGRMFKKGEIKATKNFYKTICKKCAVKIMDLHQKGRLNDENMPLVFCSKCKKAYDKLLSARKGER